MRILERLPRESGRDYALRTIKENIIHAELEPGAYISENELAAELGLSRTPVREALIELARAKAVEIAPQKRSMVAMIDYSLVEEARFTRNVLECAVVALCCTMATEEDLFHLSENVKLQEFYMKNGQYDAIMELDDQFHELLFRIAQKPQVFYLVQNMAIHFDRVRSIALNGIHDLEIVADHRKILEAIRCRDAKLAQSLMEVHLNRCKIDALAIRERYPQYFRSEPSAT